jgi:Holliday junction resolvasome RuvABC endonuclease subunit
MMIAIDPSIDNTGYALYDERGQEVSGVIRTKGSDHAEKLIYLRRAIGEIIAEYYHIKTAFVEAPLEGFSYNKYSSEDSGKSKNIEGLVVNGMAVGVILASLSDRGVKQIYEILPTEWKGGLSKGMAMSQTGKKSHDEADALMLLRMSKAEGIAAIERRIEMRKLKKKTKRARAKKPWPSKR